MALDDVDVQGSPAWWMQMMARRMLAPDRIRRLSMLDAYRRGRPPMMRASTTERDAFYAFQRISRTNVARVIVRTPAERMAIRSIRTAVVDDANGDEVAWRYFTGAGLGVAQTDVHSDLFTFSEGYVRVAVDGEYPVALRRDPRYCITAQDPANPQRTLAAFELCYDDVAQKVFAYLWLPGKQYVAWSPRKTRPLPITIPGTEATSIRGWNVLGYYPRLAFSATAFTMRPDIDEVAEADRDGGPYCETFDAPVVPMFRFENRDGVGEFEEHIDLIDRYNYTTLNRVVTAALQAYKQRALEQQADAAGGPNGGDRLPEKDPVTGETINWDEVFAPGPDALWKLPPGVKIWESATVDLNPIIAAGTDDLKVLSAATSTPITMFTPDSHNTTAEGVQEKREGLVFKVEDRQRIAELQWARVVACMFMFAPDTDRYAGDGEERLDRADASRIVIDWHPAERFSLAERSQADSQNKSLSKEMAAAKIWGLTPDEVALNQAQFAAEQLVAALAIPGAAGDGAGTDGAAG